jgi:hypothetical protein
MHVSASTIANYLIVKAEVTGRVDAAPLTNQLVMQASNIQVTGVCEKSAFNKATHLQDDFRPF